MRTKVVATRFSWGMPVQRWQTYQSTASDVGESIEYSALSNTPTDNDHDHECSNPGNLAAWLFPLSAKASSDSQRAENGILTTGTWKAQSVPNDPGSGHPYA
ncbi:hypothetical protein EG329_010314 [Mollisiaceae sp. DMI_Dod_QoI]|nr:hypothetical protein EG329_010314 [Helotiales sp. DMI_Dod_QoI]